MWNTALIPIVDRSSVEIVQHLCKQPASLVHHTQFPKTRFQLEHIAHFVHDTPMDFHRLLQKINKQCIGFY